MDKTPFGRLPRELRDKIYEYAVVHEDGIKLKHNTALNGNTAAMVARGKRSPRNTTLALAKTCRQAHKKTIKLYYQFNTFYFPFNWAGVELLKLFIRSLKTEYYEMLRHVVFRAPHRALVWEQSCTAYLLTQWYEVMQHIVENANELLPGPIYVGGSFFFDCDPDKLLPKGQFDLIIDINRIQGSLKENWHVAEQLNRYLSYGVDGTALIYLFGQMAALMGQFGPDQEESGTESHEENGDTLPTAGNDLSGQSRADSEECGREDHEGDGDADENGDEEGGKIENWDMEDDDDDLEDGKMVAATSYGDHCFARASGLRF